MEHISKSLLNHDSQKSIFKCERKRQARDIPYTLSRRLKISLYSRPSCQCLLRSSRLQFSSVLHVVSFSLKLLTFVLHPEINETYWNHYKGLWLIDDALLIVFSCIYFGNMNI